MKLRPYQEKGIAAVDAAAKNHSRLLYVQATGTGKTMIAAHLIKRFLEKDARPALFVAHREELLTQTVKTAQAVLGQDFEIGMEQGGRRALQTDHLIVASLPTIARRGSKRLDWLAEMRPSIVIYDEAHHSASETALEMLDRFGCFDLERPTPLIGLTATPTRLDNKRLVGGSEQDIFQSVAYRYSLVDAIADKWLSDLRGYTILTGVKLDEVGTVGGDLNQGQLASAVNSPHRTGLAVRHWKEMASERLTVVFCVDVAHAESVCEAFRAEGVAADYIHGGMSKKDREVAIQQWRAGQTRVMCNCMLATEGFDLPALSCVVLMRPTKSRALYEQMVGRGTRICEGKTDCLVLDLTDLTSKHDLASLPEIVGLPKGINMEGASTEEAREMLEPVMQQVAMLGDVRNLPLDQVRSQAVQVPLYSIRTPERITAVSRFRWLTTPHGYAINFDHGVIEVHEGELGWLTTLYEKGSGEDYTYGNFPTSDSAIRIGDRIIQHNLETNGGYPPLPHKNQDDPVSGKQVGYIWHTAKTLGLPLSEDYKSMTKYQAACLIDQLEIMRATGKINRNAIIK